MKNKNLTLSSRPCDVHYRTKRAYQLLTDAIHFMNVVDPTAISEGALAAAYFDMVAARDRLLKICKNLSEKKCRAKAVKVAKKLEAEGATMIDVVTAAVDTTPVVETNIIAA